MKVWFNPSGSVCYIGGSTGIEFRRHDAYVCQTGFYCVSITGWMNYCKAVCDDFGNLVRVN